MFLSLSKVLDVFASPLTWAIGLQLAALALRRRSRPAAALGLAAAAVLVTFSLEPVAGALMRWTESSAQPTFTPGVPYDAVVVLGGMIDPAASDRSGELELTEAADRIVRATAVLRAGQARMVLLSGGLITPAPGERSEADRLAAYLRDEGIAPDRIVVEGRSRNTHENAVESARVARERGWSRLLLVTSAWHASRALGCFHAVGLSPDLLPVDHQATSGADEGWLPRAAALDRSTNMLREQLGRVVYRAVGYSR